MDFLQLKAFMQRLTDRGIPGNAVVICERGREIFRWQTGFADLAAGREMTPDVPINIYSCTKIATVTAGLQLLERGELLLSDPLYAYLPAFRNMQVITPDGALVPAKNAITIQNLFTMYSTQSTFLSLADQTVAALQEKGLTITDANKFAFPEDESNYSPYISQIMGASIALQELAKLIWGSQPRTLQALIQTADGKSAVLRLGATTLQWQYLIIIAVGGLIIFLITQLFEKLYAGKMMQAACQDSYAANLLGVPSVLTICATYIIVMCVCGTCGFLVAPVFMVMRVEGPVMLTPAMIFPV